MELAAATVYQASVSLMSHRIVIRAAVQTVLAAVYRVGSIDYAWQLMGTGIVISKVESGTGEERDFIALPHRIYAGCEYYVPWFDASMRAIIARRHPYFEHSDAQFFLARRGSTPVGRIAMLEPGRFNEVHGTREARFYFLETIDDQAVADALFVHADGWARNRGLTELVGPQGFSSFAGAGVLIHGYDRTASMTMMPYHHPYYRTLVEAAGFEKLRDFLSPYLEAGRHDLAPEYVRLAEIAMKRGRFHVPVYRTKRRLRALAEEFREAYNDAWSEREVFTPITESEMKHMVDELLLVSRPSLIRVLRSGEELAGFVLAFPDLSRVMQKARGRINALTYLRLLVAKYTARRFIINGFGLRHRYRKAGGTALLFREITRVLKDFHAQGAEMTQIADDNDLMMANVKRLKADIVKTHRVYRRPVPRTVPRTVPRAAVTENDTLAARDS